MKTITAQAEGLAGFGYMGSFDHGDIGFRAWVGINEPIYKRLGYSMWSQAELMGSAGSSFYMKNAINYNVLDFFKPSVFVENINWTSIQSTGSFRDTRLGVGMEFKLW